MFKCHRIQNFVLKHQKNQILLLISGHENYYRLLRDAYKDFHFSNQFEDRYSHDYWGTYIHNVNDELQHDLPKLLELFKNAVYIDDALEQTFALDFHGLPGGERTAIGELVYQSKPYKQPVNDKHKQNAAKLAEYYKQFIQNHPSYARADYIISVPVKNKSFDLPELCVQQISRDLGITNGQPFVFKTKSTTSMKDLDDIQDKVNNMRGAFSIVENHPFKAKRVIVIDDLYDSGITLHEIGTTLQGVGAEVLGLVATKTAWGMR